MQNVVARTIQFDDSDDNIQLTKSDVTGSTPDPQVCHACKLQCLL